jgi:hypothetical protein
MATQTNEVFNPFKTAGESVQAGIEASLKFQQQASQMLMDAVSKGAFNDDMRKQWEQVSSKSLDAIRHNSEEARRVFDQNFKSGMDVLHKSFDACGNTHKVSDDLCKQTQTVWQDAFEAVRTNTEAFAQANTKMVEEWTQCFNKAFTCNTTKAAAK